MLCSRGTKDVEAAASLTSFLVDRVDNPVTAFFDPSDALGEEAHATTLAQRMAQATLIVPLVTPDALAHMCNPNNVNKYDSVLFEWWLALTLHQDNLDRIVPVFSGEVSFATKPSI